MSKQIDKLIINSPFSCPEQYWHYDRETRHFEKINGRRPAGYVVATPGNTSFDDPGQFIEIMIVNKIRERVKKWRSEGYPGTTSISKRLLDHWQNPEERLSFPFFFCQIEAIETLIFLTEAPEQDKVGLVIPSDGGAFSRWCSKMATGSGKTVVMSMLIAWQILNKVKYPKDPRFSKHILVIAPGLTVKNRLSVLNPSDNENYYDAFNIVPSGLSEYLRQGKIVIHNWHFLSWDNEEKLAKKKTVDKRGAKSDEAYVQGILQAFPTEKNIVVINDEAHHAWRINPELKVKKEFKDQQADATVWVGGLDRIHRARNIIRCFDLTATPFAPSGKKSDEEALFPWVVSDFGLNDAIEAGLVKTPRVVIRDDSERMKDLKSRLYHIYMDKNVKDDINRKANESEPIPDLVANAYYLLGKDWLETKESWEKEGHKTPPVMITVANRTETAARIRYAFDHKQILIEELCCPNKTLQIDSKVLDEAEASGEEVIISPNDSKTLNKQQRAELLRKTVDTVGRVGEPGEHIQNVISVGMLSEGWDAKTVTHIMGLRAFSSQLLCEQVVGRGLRRVSYDINEDGLLEPEYVNIFGVPFTFLPHEGNDDGPPAPPKPRTRIESLPEKERHKISWPNVIRIDHIYKTHLTLDISNAPEIELDPYKNITQAELAPMLSGKPNVSSLTDINLKEISGRYRVQTLIFETAKRIYNAEKPKWKGTPEYLLGQLIKIVSNYIQSDKIRIKNASNQSDELKKRVLILLNINTIIQTIWTGIRDENTQKLVPIFDTDRPIHSTAGMKPWYTSKPCEWANKSHISHIVVDGTWEASEAYFLDKSPMVDSFVKNDHIGFSILYNYCGVIRKFYPDFIVKMKDGTYLILETKGQDSEQNKVKRSFLKEWVDAINSQGGFGHWKWAVSFHPSDCERIIKNTP